MQTPAFSPLVLRWKPVGQSDSEVVANAYCVLEVADRAAIGLLERKVAEASIVQLGSHALHILARTDARGVLMTVPRGAAGAPDALSLPALAPLLCPLGIAFKLWWTCSRKAFDDVLRLEHAGDAQHPLQFAQSLALAFDEHVELPPAIDAALVEYYDGPALRELFQRRADDAYPAQLLTLAPDGRTWCLVLHDQALEIGLDAAFSIQQAGGLVQDYRLPAHQVLLAEVLDILRRRGHEKGPFVDIIPKHEHLCGGEYHALRDDIRYALERVRREVGRAGTVLGAVIDRALHELSVHPYPEGDYEQRAPGAISCKRAAKSMLDARAVHLQDGLVAHFAKHSAGQEERLLAIARGERDPADATDIEHFLAQTGAVLAWLHKASSFVQKGVKIGLVALDPKNVDELTSWVESVLIAAAQKKSVGKQQLFDAVTRGMRVVQVWLGLAPDFALEGARTAVPLSRAAAPTRVKITKATAERWHSGLDRAGSLLKLLNVISLADALYAKDGEKPSVLKTMTDLHGFVDGLEGTYRILSDTAQTQLGTSLKSLGKLLGPVAVFVAGEDAWDRFQTGDALGTLLASGGVGLAFITVAMDLAVANPHPAAKAAIFATGLAIGVGLELTTDEEERLVEKYRPHCEDAGAYLEGKNAVSMIEQVLDDIEWTIGKNRSMANRLADQGFRASNPDHWRR
jgi:hypothetical protein